VKTVPQPRAGIPWSIAFSPEAYCHYCGVGVDRYHADPETMMQVQLEGARIVHERFGLPLRRGVAPDCTSYCGVSVFGLQVSYQPDQPPSPIGHPIKSAEEAAELQIPEDLTRAGMIPRMLEYYEYMKAHAPEDVHVGFGTGGQGPFTAAVVLRGNGIFLDIYEKPHLVHRFLEVLTETDIRLREFNHRINGTAPGDGIGYADDYSGLLSPEHYREFALKYLLQIAEHFGATRKSIHTELVRREHLKILQDAGFTSIDVGADPYLTVRDCAEVLDVDFTMYFYTCPEHLLSNPQQIRQVYGQMVADGARRMCGDVCPGVPDENVLAFIEVAKEYE